MQNKILLFILCLLTACASEKTFEAKNQTTTNPNIASTSEVQNTPGTQPVEESQLSQNSTSDEKVTAAKLSSQDKNKLLEIDQNNYKNIPVKIVLPTYIPDGFKVEKVEVGDDKRFGPGYSITYSDDSNNCFEISGASGGFGAGAEDFEIITVNSKALGNVELGYTQFDQVTNQPRIGFNQFTVQGVIPSEQQYSFWSPGIVNSQCNAIEFQEAAKIVESLDYLNP
ncbi:hypothetical protein HJG54_20865 [Leptolyngbya sp. NK1-12]|uniref:Lipoprotein n=1 Tax=Leptolyngbya sp. NK1-12 TaxID=2547451 RepID=A0AA96WH93_9CYAN|nr:hypothetical protein [Leptolyngbya sp. NK1-12]WNZ25060.1 hypothetical protein HJG54_20865 [Leptolyngbya sp. NK1-12]